MLFQSGTEPKCPGFDSGDPAIDDRVDVEDRIEGESRKSASSGYKFGDPWLLRT